MVDGVSGGEVGDVGEHQQQPGGGGDGEQQCAGEEVALAPADSVALVSSVQWVITGRRHLCPLPRSCV